MISVKVETSGIIKALRDFQIYLPDELEKSLKKVMPLVQQRARTTHRFKTRTGKLVGSILQDVKKTTKGPEARLFQNGRKARYGKFVHNGHGSWAADRFIDNAMKYHTKTIRKEFENAISIAVSKAHLAQGNGIYG